MRRFALGFLVALALAVPVTLVAAPPKMVSVTNPMSANLDGGGYSISNVQAVYAGNVYSRGEIVAGVAPNNGVIQFSTPTSYNGPGVIAGDADPSLGGETAMPAGSIYLRSNGQWWRKTADTPNTAWTCEAGCS